VHHRAKDYTGQTFGYLTGVRYQGTNGRRSLWVFQCICGTEVTRVASGAEKWARRGGSSSCGCMAAAANKTHGMTNHPAYWVWRSMRDRCRLPSHQAWRNYGARGIRVCPEWDASFAAFWRDMGPAYQSGLTLDRKDNDGDYTPKNCRWTSHTVQAGNRRGALSVDLTKAHNLTGVPKSTLLYRWHRNLSMTSATLDPTRASWSEVLRDLS